VRDHRLNASFPLFQLQQPTRINPAVRDWHETYSVSPVLRCAP
jgi:hypothetical protein